MKEIIQILKLLITSEVANLLIGFGLFLILIGFLKGIPKLVTIKTGQSRQARLFGTIILGLGLIICLVSWIIKQETFNFTWLRDYLGVILLAIFAGIAFWGALLVKKRLNELFEEEKRLVANVEDATRHVLHGFPEIFSRSLKLINEAEREIWLINFALNFGHPHAQIDSICDEYKKLYPNSNLKVDVKSFFSILHNDKVANEYIPVVKILTVTNDSIEKDLIEPLSKRKEYSKIYSKEKKKALCKDIQDCKTEIQKRMRTRNGIIWDEGIEHYGKLLETDSIPIQLLITGIKSDDGDRSPKFGCLVFMVGTEILSGIEDEDKKDSFKEPGFYTEMQEVVDVYKSLAQALINKAEKQSKENEILPLYFGP